MDRSDGSMLDKLLKAATGMGNQELVQRGTQVYPESVEPNVSNRPTHRLAANMMTERFGPIAAQLAGLGMEGLEEVSSRASGGGSVWDWDDIAANVRGSGDALGLPLLQGFMQGRK